MGWESVEAYYAAAAGCWVRCLIIYTFSRSCVHIVRSRTVLGEYAAAQPSRIQCHSQPYSHPRKPPGTTRELCRTLTMTSAEDHSSRHVFEHLLVMARMRKHGSERLHIV
jgi:hypothetical protein